MCDKYGKLLYDCGTHSTWKRSNVSFKIAIRVGSGLGIIGYLY